MHRTKSVGASLLVMVGLLGLVPGSSGHSGDWRSALLTSNRSTDQRRTPDLVRPLSFEANHGQADANIDFLSRDGEHSVFLSPTEAVLPLTASHEGREDSSLRMQILGADPMAARQVEQPLLGRVNYLQGSDPNRWHTDIPTYGRVGYRDVYPGIDVAYYGKGGQLEYDFVVAPGADPDAIASAFAGADDVNVDPGGDLVLTTPYGEVRQAKPFVYQDIDGARRPVAGGFALRRDDQVSFELGAYDVSRPLVIDPVFVFSTHLGGSRADRGHGVAVDAQGYAYVVGETCSADFPTASPLRAFKSRRDCIDNASSSFSIGDIVVTKLAPDGSVVYSTFLGGTSFEREAKVAVDEEGQAYVTGQTRSFDFPITEGAFQSVRRGSDSPDDIFVSKLSSEGSQLLYSTFLGGDGNEFLPTVDLDDDGNVFVAGSTESPNFPSTPGAFEEVPGDRSYFLAKLSPEGGGADDLAYSTFLVAGTSALPPVGLAVDAEGNANLTGNTQSKDFPTTPGAFQPTCAVNPGQSPSSSFHCQDAFVARINPGGNGLDDLVYSSFLGGSESISGGNNADFRGKDEGQDIAVAPDGTIYVVGVANSPDFPITAGAYQTSLAGCATIGCDAFVSKINPAGAGPADLVYSSFIGGGGASDVPQAIAVGASGRAVVTGFTQSTSFPLVDPVQERCGCFTTIEADAFAFVLQPAGTGDSDLVFSTFLGGTGRDVGEDIAVAGNNIYVVGSTNSPPTSGDELGPKQFPTTPGAFQPEPIDGFDAFVSKIDLQSTSPPSGSGGLSVGDAKRVEGDRGTRMLQLTVSLATPNLREVVEVGYRTVDGTAKEGRDYQARRGTLRFRPGATTMTVDVEINGDTRVEPDETLVLELHQPKRALIDDDIGAATIVDDD